MTNGSYIQPKGQAHKIKLIWDNFHNNTRSLHSLKVICIHRSWLSSFSNSSRLSWFHTQFNPYFCVFPPNWAYLSLSQTLSASFGKITPWWRQEFKIHHFHLLPQTLPVSLYLSSQILSLSRESTIERARSSSPGLPLGSSEPSVAAKWAKLKQHKLLYPQSNLTRFTSQFWGGSEGIFVPNLTKITTKKVTCIGPLISTLTRFERS